ncbi:MAG: GNAT family acetyltransferase [Planctomyces sp.]|nr:GNAT family acetyltransferase [Planctomyces sp.]
MQQPITGYHLDEEGHWVAQLACGHFQHVRHDPPWMIREWVTTPKGRHQMLGHHLACKKCDEHVPPDSLHS